MDDWLSRDLIRPQNIFGAGCAAIIPFALLHASAAEQALAGGIGCLSAQSVLPWKKQPQNSAALHEEA